MGCISASSNTEDLLTFLSNPRVITNYMLDCSAIASITEVFFPIIQVVRMFTPSYMKDLLTFLPRVITTNPLDCSFFTGVIIMVITIYQGL